MFIDQFRCAVEEALSLIERGTDFVYESLCFLKVSALHDHAAKHMSKKMHVASASCYHGEN